MVIADLNPEVPVALVHSELPFRIQGVRNAGGPAFGEPVEIRLTEAQAKWLIKRLQATVDSLEVQGTVHALESRREK